MGLTLTLYGLKLIVAFWLPAWRVRQIAEQPNEDLRSLPRYHPQERDNPAKPVENERAAMKKPGRLWTLSLLVLVLCHSRAPAKEPAQEPAIEIGSRRELFVDRHLIEKLDDVRLHLHEPHDEGVVLKFDQPWEGIHCGYCTVIRNGATLRVYYRGMPSETRDGTAGEVTCVADSDDGTQWTRPKLGLFLAGGTKENNVVLAGDPPFSHNFSPFIDTRPGCTPEQRYKALSGTDVSGLLAFVSPDGLRWTKLRGKPAIPRKGSFKFDWMFDSQNVAFWSDIERKYVCYFRVYDGGRRIGRCDSIDFLHWSDPVLMSYLTPSYSRSF